MANILAIKGSARRGGNSDTVLQAALEALQREEEGLELKTITPRELEIAPCRSCHGCWDTGKCVINDEMQEIYQQFLEARSIVVSAPVYFTSVPGHLKVMIDRFQCFWASTYRLGKPPEPRRNGMFLCVGAMERTEFFKNSSLIIRTWLSTLNVKCRVQRFYPGLDAPEDILEHTEYNQDAAKAALELLKSNNNN